MDVLLGILLALYIVRALIRGEVTVKNGITEWRDKGTSAVIIRDESPAEFRSAILCYAVVDLFILAYGLIIRLR